MQIPYPQLWKEKNMWWKFNENADLFRVADQIGIKTEHIHFTNYDLKAEFLDGKGFLFHLDDDDVEIKFISLLKDIIPINVLKDDWWNIIKDLIKNKI